MFLQYQGLAIRNHKERYWRKSLCMGDTGAVFRSLDHVGPPARDLKEKVGKICTGILSDIKGSYSRFSVLAPEDLKRTARHITKSILA